jgi:pilus assembly protein Flp/PilA
MHGSRVELTDVLFSRQPGVALGPQAKTKGIEMNTIRARMKAFLVNEDGPTATEYAVMLALVIVVCMVAISALSTSLQGIFTGVAGELDAAAPGGS